MEQLAVILLFVVFWQTRIMNLKKAIACLCIQSLVISAVCLIASFSLHTGFHAYVPAILTFFIKACFIPYTLFKIAGRLTDEKEILSVINVNYSTFASASSFVVAYIVLEKMIPTIAQQNIVAASFVLTLTGLILIVMRSRALMQIVGLITMENGIYLFGMAMTDGLPLIIELGVFFDVLVAAVVLVVLTNRLKISFMTTDTKVMKKLKG